MEARKPDPPIEEPHVRAVIFDRYGSPEVLRIADVERPVPKEDEVLVRVHASTVTRTDCGLRSAEYVVTRFFTGVLRPKRGVVGMELAGEVEAVGPGVTKFAVGDRVFGVRSGANAEYICVREGGVLAHMPANTSYEDAAAVADGACSALSMLHQAGLREGQELLVYGATGSIGTAAVQLGKQHFGAHVTAVGNTKNLELVRSLGADEVIDYLQEDFRRYGVRYDVIFDAVGKQSFLRCRRSLKPRGIYVASDGLRNLLFPLVTWMGGRRARIGIAKYRQEDVVLLKELIEAGKYRAVIDRRYPLEDVREATRYVETHQKTGNVILTVTP
jgi:NADPH:quinone reductase-like Zn-dependent oxidoreductase